jgi:hypothetical protein
VAEHIDGLLVVGLEIGGNHSAAVRHLPPSQCVPRVAFQAWIDHALDLGMGLEPACDAQRTSRPRRRHGLRRSEWPRRQTHAIISAIQCQRLQGSACAEHRMSNFAGLAETYCPAVDAFENLIG